jgi:hypothetical protein
VRGVDTTHLRTTVDLNRLAPNPSSLPSGIDLDSVPYDAWLDSHDRPVRQRFALTYPFSGGLGSSRTDATVTTTGDTYDYGKPLHVTLPRPDQVFRLHDASQFGTYLTA